MLGATPSLAFVGRAAEAAQIGREHPPAPERALQLRLPHQGAEREGVHEHQHRLVGGLGIAVEVREGAGTELQVLADHEPKFYCTRARRRAAVGVG